MRKLISALLVLAMVAGLLPVWAVETAAANPTTRYNAGDTDYAILNLYKKFFADYKSDTGSNEDARPKTDPQDVDLSLYDNLL